MKSPPIIVVDIGNTSTSLAIARGGAISRVRQMDTRSQTSRNIRRQLLALTAGQGSGGAALGSVVPAKTGPWLTALKSCTGRQPLLINHRLQLGLRLDYPRPKTIGADRLANACAAAERYGPPVVVADFGTALTFDVIARQRVYQGGIIVAGLPLMTHYLATQTALLPHVNLSSWSAAARQKPAIGKSTAQAIRIGARWGYLGMVREIFNLLRQSLKEPRLKLCATGGYAGWVLKGAGLKVSLDPHLTLRGLSLIYDLNQTGR